MPVICLGSYVTFHFYRSLISLNQLPAFFILPALVMKFLESSLSSLPLLLCLSASLFLFVYFFIHERPDNSCVTCLAGSPLENRKFASAGVDGCVKLWYYDSNRKVFSSWLLISPFQKACSFFSLVGTLPLLHRDLMLSCICCLDLSINNPSLTLYLPKRLTLKINLCLRCLHEYN